MQKLVVKSIQTIISDWLFKKKSIALYVIWTNFGSDGHVNTQAETYRVIKAEETGILESACWSNVCPLDFSGSNEIWWRNRGDIEETHREYFKTFL